ncbi:MAG TPA: GNAT family N-acetyltransferase [Pirellulales bacterium]|nr:GNAT family N-acetyltransferase [Pirellulales bacterium]
MSDPPATPLNISLAVSSEWPVALQLLFNRLDEIARPLQIAAAIEELQRTTGEAQPLFVARRGPALVAAIWMHLMPGRVASLWPPGIAPGEPAATATPLIDFATAKAAEADIRLIQALTDTDTGPQADWLRQSGFKYTADLLYLVSLSEKFPHVPPHTELILEPLSETAETTVSGAQMARLAAIVQRTYVNTQDCPTIHGLRSVDDVLATYRSVGTFNPAQWFFVRHQLRDVGCVLLANHPQHRHCELVYMGLVPEARGHGWGLEIVRYAQWVAANSNFGEGTPGESSTQRMVLAVDAANSPAISLYAAADFETWDRRSVFLREIPAKN